MKPLWWRTPGLLFGIALALLLPPGCGRRAPKDTPRPMPEQKTDVPLPEWAPENPSPEFLRAARVLKPIPPEILGSFGDKAGPQGQVLLARFRTTWTPAYEFFGALSDEEIEHFKTSKEVRLSVKSMTRTQRHALDSYFDACRKTMAAAPNLPDLLLLLYKDGAEEDLSNVDAGFVGDEGRMVSLQCWIRRPDGSVSTLSNSVATM